MAGHTAPTRANLLIRGIAVIGAFVAAGFFLRAVESGQFLNAGWIDTYVRQHGLAGQLIFFAAGTLFTAFGLPRQVICFLGGYAFGLAAGTALALGATVTGCALAFLFARLAARDLIAGRFSNRLRKADAFLGAHPFSAILMIRLLPVGSNLATNLAAGVSSAGLWPFLAASAFGHLPQTLVFTLVGSGINVDPEIRITLGVALFVLSMLLGTHLYFRLRRDATLKGVIAVAEAEDSAGNGENGANGALPAAGPRPGG